MIQPHIESSPQEIARFEVVGLEFAEDLEEMRKVLRNKVEGNSVVRRPAVAGSFYPSDPEELQQSLAELVGPAISKGAARKDPIALIAPHAGYRYSGRTAGIAFEEFRDSEDRIERVVVIGPSHRVRLRGLALPGCDAFQTPLGSIPIDRELVELMTLLPQISVNAAAHAMEHSLEVELPFLQTILGEFRLLPLVVGMATPEEVAEVLRVAWSLPGTRVVVSSDLSHYLPDAEAQVVDRATAERILSLDYPLEPHEACGAVPINGLLCAGQTGGLVPRLLDLRNSSAASGDFEQVVGYGAFAFDRKLKE
ncbi:MAG: AmmeMemoRadiSam system protein B [Thermoanaerobaculia bacterium]